MNESVESRLRKYQTAAPPETLRTDILSNLRARRRRHREQLILRASIALLMLAILGAQIVENRTASRMIAVMSPSVSTQPAESGMLAWLARPNTLLLLSPRPPVLGNYPMAASSIDIIEGDT